MTDPRFGDELLDAIRRLPFGSGVIFRHYALDEEQRYKLYLNVKRACRRRGHVLLLAGDERTALHWHADGFHQRSARRSKSIHSAAVHNSHELQQVRRLGVDMILVSPLFATNSHKGQRPLGRLAFNRLTASTTGVKVIALGGVTRQRARSLNPRLIHGWASIDAFRKTPG